MIVRVSPSSLLVALWSIERLGSRPEPLVLGGAQGKDHAEDGELRPDAKDDIKDVVVVRPTVPSGIGKVGPGSDGRHHVGRAQEPEDRHGDEHSRALRRVSNRNNTVRQMYSPKRESSQPLAAS